MINKTKATNLQLFRQGDILFKKIASLPAGESKRRENGVVAYGEQTGHHHSLAPECSRAASILEFGDSLFVDVFAECLIEVGSDYVSVDGRRYWAEKDFSGNVTIPIGQYRGVAFVHQEHSPVILPFGVHQYVAQREYQPEGIRSVVD